MHLRQYCTEGKAATVIHSFKVIISVFLVVLCSSSVHAHNLWILGDAHNNGDGTFHLYFEHHVGPGDGAFLGPIEKRGKTWLATPQGVSMPLTMEMVKEKDTKYLAGSSGARLSGSYAINHTSVYGIYHGRLDFFHGRYIEAENRQGLEALSETTNLPVQIVPVWTEAGLLLKILYFSNPKPQADIFLLEGGGKEERFKADKKGEFLLGKVKPGTYFLSTRIIENEPAGAFEYEAFKGIMHVSTLTIKIAAGF